MRIDIHFHALGSGANLNDVDEDIYFNVKDNQHWFTRILYNMIEEDLKQMEADLNRDGKISTGEYFDLVYRIVTSSEEINGVVLLGLDALFSPETGKLDERRTDLWVSNRFLDRKVKELNERLRAEPDPRKRKKRFFFGASVSPNRTDWEAELDYVLSQTEAVLIKWIPSVQHIYLMDEGHREFYQALASNNIPLLCHVGPEYSFPEGIRRRELDDFRYLKRPLEYGVRVIAAHCAAPVFPPFEKDEIKEFYALMRDANGGREVQLFADTSALSLSTRVALIPEILNTFPPEWLVHGSDFPIPIDGWPHLPWVTHNVTPEEYIQIYKTKNPLDKDVRIKRAHGFSDSILENTDIERLLK